MAVTSEPVVVSNGLAPHLRPAKVKSPMAASKSALDIIDIRRAAVETNLKEEIISLFHPKEGPRQLPTLLLYNERGLQLFEEITYLDEYYLTNDEIEILRTSSAQIAKEIPNGCMLIELGSGNLRKVNLLLQAIEDTGKSVDYYALDLSRTELERTLAQLPAYKHVRSHGLLGTYDDGREWLKRPSILSRQKCILTLGSSIGNFPRDEASDFLKSFADVLSPVDRMIVGLDACNDPARVYHAYNDKEGLTHQFVLNGLSQANEILGEEVFRLEDWKVIGEYVYDHEGGRHQAFYSPIKDTLVMGEMIKSHERIQVEQSLKYSQAETTRLWNRAGMTEIGSWMLGTEYGLHLLEKSKMPFSLLPSVYARSALPSLDDWDGLWAAWDAVTTKMLPHAELLEKPIKLRNACIFYLGHIPTFLDIQLTKTTKETPTDPAMYYQIFERGIDPDVDNPELCHAHSEIPDEWPPLDQILAYQDRVRGRLKDIYGRGIDTISRAVGRAIWVGFEHEIMHLETLLYMMLQSDKTLPPPGTEQPNFEKLAEKARSARVPNEWFNIPAQDIVVGLDDPEDGSDSDTHFGWDNEKPPRYIKVHSFQAQARPITNGEYAQYMNDQHVTKLPASWAELHSRKETTGYTNGDSNGAHVNGHSHTNGHINGYTNGHTNGHTNGYSNGYSNGHSNGYANGSTKLPESFLEGKAVRTVYGLVPLKYALDWPIFASYDELATCASWMGGRIPTFEEARSIYSYVHSQKKLEAEKKLGRTLPAVNGHLSNNGVQETPPSRTIMGAKGSSAKLDDSFVDLDGANIGFHHWHPVPVTARGSQLAGQAELGGVWEWTSSPLTRYDEFEPMSLYPAYTADFFDGKHNIVLGGSWATHPRIAGRKSFVNWYQRNYPYAWCGARLVRDLN